MQQPGHAGRKALATKKNKVNDQDSRPCGAVVERLAFGPDADSWPRFDSPWSTAQVVMWCTEGSIQCSDRGTSSKRRSRNLTLKMIRCWDDHADKVRGLWVVCVLLVGCDKFCSRDLCIASFPEGRCFAVCGCPSFQGASRRCSEAVSSLASGPRTDSLSWFGPPWSRARVDCGIQIKLKCSNRAILAERRSQQKKALLSKVLRFSSCSFMFAFGTGQFGSHKRFTLCVLQGVSRPCGVVVEWMAFGSDADS